MSKNSYLQTLAPCRTMYFLKFLLWFLFRTSENQILTGTKPMSRPNSPQSKVTISQLIDAGEQLGKTQIFQSLGIQNIQLLSDILRINVLISILFLENFEKVGKHLSSRWFRKFVTDVNTLNHSVKTCSNHLSQVLFPKLLKKFQKLPLKQ